MRNTKEHPEVPRLSSATARTAFSIRSKWGRQQKGEARTGFVKYLKEKQGAVLWGPFGFVQWWERIRDMELIRTIATILYT